jgi:signal transduction histidine kinase
MNDIKQSDYINDEKKLSRIIANYENRIVELKARNKELQRSAETQKKIISILAHDVRNPLNSIKNIIELKRSNVLNANDTAELMDMMVNQLTGTIKMVENVVNWGQLHLNIDRLQLSDFDLYIAVENIFVSESLSSIIKNNKLINNVTRDTVIKSDQRILEFILRNLVSNSNKFTQNGRITIDMAENNGKTAIWVTDTGVGMTNDQISELFSNNSIKTTLGTNNEKGSGLGLMLVKEYIDRLGGSIAVESKIDEGTTFKITI